MKKKTNLIMVINKDLLFGDDYFNGFRLSDEINYESRILKNHEYLERNFVEKNFSYKQPIPYAIIINPNLKQMFSYKRANKNETRYKGKWSFGIGGYIEKNDKIKLNPIKANFLRELNEEIEISGQFKIKFLGYINDDSDELGKVHFGMLYVVETDARIIKPKDSEIANGKLRNIKELEKICSSDKPIVETWSKIAFEYLKTI